MSLSLSDATFLEPLTHGRAPRAWGLTARVSRKCLCAVVESSCRETPTCRLHGQVLIRSTENDSAPVIFSFSAALPITSRIPACSLDMDNLFTTRPRGTPEYKSAD